jgi:hypothetical protein
MATALLISTLFFGCIVSYIFFKEKLAFYHPIFLVIVWHFLGYILTPWLLLLKGQWGYLTRLGVPLNNDYYLVKTIILANLGFFSVFWGYRCRLLKNWVSRRQIPPMYINQRLALLVGAVFMSLAAYAIWNYHPIPGIKKSLMTGLYARNQFGGSVYTQSSGYVVLSYGFLMGVGLLWYLVSRGRGLGWHGLFWGTSLSYFFFILMRGWHRAGWVLFLFGLLSLGFILQRRRWPSVKLLLALSPLIIVFNMTGIDRQAWFKIVEDGYSVEYFVGQALERIAENKVKSDISDYEFNTFQAALYPDRIPYEWGRPYVNAWIVSALPRSVFKDKDNYFLTTNISNYNEVLLTSGPCPGIYFELYRNFGIPGIIIGCFIFGTLLQGAWCLLLKYGDKGIGYQFVSLTYAGFITFFPQLLRDGLESLVSGYFFIFTPIVLTLVLSQMQNRALCLAPPRCHLPKKLS